MSAQSASNIILIVDDNPNNLSVLAETLRFANHEVRIATDGESALSQLEQHQPALILLDVMMPGIDGFETCQRIKENPNLEDIPVIFMTALTDKEETVRGLSLGAVDYISKPFQDLEVLSRVESHLQRSELIRSLKIRNQQLAVEIGKRQHSEELNRKLESCIEVSTAVLSEASSHFQAAQQQIANSEKLSILGELVAGVAHEINNPISCITNNVEFVAEHTQQLIEHIEYQRAVLQDNRQHLDAKEFDKIDAHAQEIDLDFILEDMPGLIESMATSGDRIQAISQSLRTFARADTQDKQYYNLHEGLDSTLLILRHRIKEDAHRPEIFIEKAYADLPEVPCYPGQINQVFMNILANAIDALELQASLLDSGAEAHNHELKITIRTLVEVSADKKPQVIIEIQDNAGGMPESVRDRIFENQFTTKAAGKGTGLGLSIAYQIVTETHLGQIECQSTEGQGSLFRITLPAEELSED